MPHPIFNSRFLLLFTDEKSISTISAYECPQIKPVYFVSTSSDEDTASQLSSFKSSPEFLVLKEQYESTLLTLKDWCKASGIEIKLFDHQETEYSAFDLLAIRLFNGFFSVREVVLYNDGKKSLEELVILLGNDRINHEHKKDVLSNLQESIGVCGDGVLTNILDSASDLKASLNFGALLGNIKRVLIQQFALDFAKPLIGKEDIGNEIHYVNTFYNYVANSYGVPEREDKFVSLCPININQLQQFDISLQKYFTSEVVLDRLINQLTNEINFIRQQIKSDFFPKDNTAIAFTSKDGKELRSKVDALVRQWNNKYSSLAELGTHALTVVDDLGQITLVPFNKASITAKIVTGFSTAFLNNEKNKFVVATNALNTTVLTFAHGQLWFTYDGVVLGAEQSELFLEIELSAANADSYWFLANELLMRSSQHDGLNQIIGPLHGSQRGKNVVWMLAEQIDQPEVSDLLRRLIKKGLITNNHLASLLVSKSSTEKNLILWLAREIAWPGVADLLKNVIEAGLVTREHIAFATISGANIGKNTAWWLASCSNQSRIADIFSCLLQQGLMTKEQLAFSPTLGPDIGKNTIWWLARVLHQPGIVTLFNNLIALELVTDESLALAPKHGPNKGVNALWRLLFYIEQPGVVTLFEVLVSKKLITKEIIMESWDDLCRLKQGGREGVFHVVVQLLAKNELISIEQLNSTGYNKITLSVTSKNNRFFAAEVKTIEAEPAKDVVDFEHKKVDVTNNIN